MSARSFAFASIPAAGPSPLARGLVRRSRLLERLQRAAEGPVTLLSAPAGSGKTLLVGSWLRHGQSPGPVAWVSVERDERDPTRFWSMVIEGLVVSGAGEGLEAPVPAPEAGQDELVGRLLEWLWGLREPVVLVLDDLHHLKAPEARRGLQQLLGRAPPQLRVILISRRDPRLGLHRRRVAGELTEIRAAELEFTLDEAGELLRMAGVELGEPDLALLRDRTEGWAAGLRLAAMWLAGRADAGRFVAEFSGSERTVAEYLLGEVLDSQPAEVREMLLRTCVLERVNGDLANLLSGREDGEWLLQELEEANAFVVALDTQRSWFRYHQLFADLLRLQLRREAPGEVLGLHRQAAGWYAAHGLVVDAIRHAQLGEDWTLAAGLLVEHWFSLYLDGKEATVGGLLAGLPAELVQRDAELATTLAAHWLTVGRWEEADAYLALAEAGAATVPGARRRRFESMLAVVQLYRGRKRGDIEAVLERASAILSPADGDGWLEVVDNHDQQAMTLLSLGIAELWTLRLEEAERDLRQGRALAHQIARPYVAVGCLGHLAITVTLRGRMPEGERRALEAVAIAERLGWSDDPIVAAAYTLLGVVAYNRHRLEEGERWLDRGDQVLLEAPEPALGVALRFLRGQLRLSQGRSLEACELFGEAERLHRRLRAPHFLAQAFTAWQLRARLALDDTPYVRTALAEAGEDADANPEWLIAQARLHLRDGAPQMASRTVAPVLDHALFLPTAELEIEASLLDAVAHDQLGEAEAAQTAVEKALELAQPEGRIRVVTDGGDRVRDLLARHPRHRTAHPSFLVEVLDHFADSSPMQHGDPWAGLVQPLSERELAVLRYLPSNLTASEIGVELFLSVHTVKTYMRSMYAKLGVHRRSEAVQRARELGLLAPSPPR